MIENAVLVPPCAVPVKLLDTLKVKAEGPMLASPGGTNAWKTPEVVKPCAAVTLTEPEVATEPAGV